MLSVGLKEQIFTVVKTNRNQATELKRITSIDGIIKYVPIKKSELEDPKIIWIK